MLTPVNCFGYHSQNGIIAETLFRVYISYMAFKKVPSTEIDRQKIRIMKILKVLFLIIFTLGICSDVLSQNFRKTKFGDNIQSVKSKEGIPINEFTRELDSSISIVYTDKLEGINTYVIFTFKDKKFIRGAYDLTNSDSLNNVSFTQFKLIEELLIVKYGKPTISIDYRSNPNFNKEVQLASEWNLGETKISHTLFTSNFHLIDYNYEWK